MQLVFIHDFYFETVAVIFQKGRIADFEKAFAWITRDVEKWALRKLGLKSGLVKTVTWSTGTLEVMLESMGLFIMIPWSR